MNNSLSTHESHAARIHPSDGAGRLAERAARDGLPELEIHALAVGLIAIACYRGSIRHTRTTTGRWTDGRHASTGGRVSLASGARGRVCAWHLLSGNGIPRTRSAVLICYRP